MTKIRQWARERDKGRVSLKIALFFVSSLFGAKIKAIKNNLGQKNAHKRNEKINRESNNFNAGEQ